MFSGLASSAIKSRRIAFLAYASEVVFGEHLEKRDVRILVADLISHEKESARAAKEEAIGALAAGINPEIVKRVWGGF